MFKNTWKTAGIEFEVEKLLALPWTAFFERAQIADSAHHGQAAVNSRAGDKIHWERRRRR